jgi:hypothetical protein
LKDGQLFSPNSCNGVEFCRKKNSKNLAETPGILVT